MPPARKPVPVVDATRGSKGISGSQAQPIWGAYKDSDSNSDTMKKSQGYQKDAQSASDKGVAANVGAANARAKNGQSAIPSETVPSYKKGGMVKKTGLAKLHAGEKVIPKNKVGAVTKALRKTAGGKR